MMLYAEALERLMAAARERGLGPFQTVPLKESVGRVTSGRIMGAEDLPAFDNSAMDGFAVPSALTRSACEARPVRMPVAGRLSAGDAPASADGDGALEITTGAPVPMGCDAIVRVEDVELLAGGRAIALRAPAEPGDFIRRRGDDFRAGSLVIDGGMRLDPRHILALAALGVARVSVRVRPRVALISTGRELVDADKRPAPGQIRNATGPYLAAALEAMGAEIKVQNAVGDDPGDFKRRVEALGDEVDLIVATGGVSMGRHDFVPKAVTELGAEVLFHKTATRPGKPALAATFGNGPLFFGLPGNPISTVVALRFFIAPVLRFLLGQPPEAAQRARLSAAVEKPEGLRCFFKGRLTQGPSGLQASALSGQASFQIQPLLDADCWLALPEKGRELAAGEAVEVYPL